jgi:nitroreductase
MNEVMQTILHRRSIRKFRPEQIAPEQLDEILLAGEYAPCAGSRQSPVFAVCQNEQLNEELGQINMEKLREIMDIRPPMAPGEKSAAPKLPFGQEIRSAFQGAPTVVTIFAPKDWYNFTLDCAVAAENMALAAEALGVGSCIIARAAETFATPRGKELQAQWGIGEEYEAKLHLLLGYPEGDHPQAKPRRENRRILIK